MNLCGSASDKDRLLKRLKRIEGQVRSLSTMVETDENCIELLRQMASVSGALKGAWMQVLEDHLRGHVKAAAGNPALQDSLIDELMETFEKIR